jgi:chlorophyllase
MACSGGTATPDDSEPDDVLAADGGAGSPGDAAAPCTGDGCGTQASDPGEAGALSFTTETATVFIGDEEIALTIYSPNAEGPLPLVIFTHGFQLVASQYASYGEHLASWGYLVVMPDFPGGLIGGPNHRELKVMLMGVVDWVVDNASEVAGPLGGKADVGAIALAGHSMGGKLSLLVASEDTRPAAVFGVDPVDAGGGPLGGSEEDFPSVTPALMPQISVPIVLLGETVNATGGLGGACAPEEDNFHQYYLHAESKALEIEVLGANHMSFLDNPDCGFTCSACPAGTDDKPTTRRLTRRYMTAFFEVFLKSDDAYRSYLTGDVMSADASEGLVISSNKNGF